MPAKARFSVSSFRPMAPPPPPRSAGAQGKGKAAELTEPSECFGRKRRADQRSELAVGGGVQPGHACPARYSSAQSGRRQQLAHARVRPGAGEVPQAARAVGTVRRRENCDPHRTRTRPRYSARPLYESLQPPAGLQSVSPCSAPADSRSQTTNRSSRNSSPSSFARE